MSKTFSSNADHLDSSSVATTAAPLVLAVWFYTSIGTGRKFLSLANSSDLTKQFSLGLDVLSSGGKLSAYRSVSSSVSQQALSSIAITANTWMHGIACFDDSSTERVYLNGANKGTATGGSFVPTGINQTVFSGRVTDHQFGIIGQGSHGALWTRANFSDLEAAYLGSGGHPRALKGLIDYWAVASAESPVDDRAGTNDLTVTGTTAGTTNPIVETFMTGGPVGDLSYTNGTAIAAINLSAGNGYFEDVFSAYTVTLKQLGSPVSLTGVTASGAQTAVREINVASVAGLVAGNYIKVTSGGTPTRVLAVGASSVLVANDQTFSIGAQLYNYPVNTLTIPGCSITSNSFSGTPSANGTNALSFFRATNNTTATLLADTDLFTIDVSGGGGGGSSIFLPAGLFCGGLSGG